MFRDCGFALGPSLTVFGLIVVMSEALPMLWGCGFAEEKLFEELKNHGGVVSLFWLGLWKLCCLRWLVSNFSGGWIAGLVYQSRFCGVGAVSCGSVVCIERVRRKKRNWIVGYVLNAGDFVSAVGRLENRSWKRTLRWEFEKAKILWMGHYSRSPNETKVVEYDSGRGEDMKLKFDSLRVVMSWWKLLGLRKSSSLRANLKELEWGGKRSATVT